ncbi:MAG: hypothetical protein A4E53_02849 [Pelotomaculum sp. PtaB.Bin104]|nr:MAG: hypothetical protein A4E53_02849 [Pelotomaculum sp. PtaB.Bin104]
MQILYFDCFSGISGDMTLGALLDLGIDAELFKRELQKLELTGYEITVQKKVSHGISGIDVMVVTGDRQQQFNAGDSHEHVSRNLEDIEKLINASGLSNQVKSLSIRVFREIARAEAKVHNKQVKEVHFHEVGAVDSIVDIIGSAICLELLGAPMVFASPLHEGHGFIECRHGLLPVPVPAVLEMLADSAMPIPLIAEDIPTELVTPTGIGMIKCLSAGFGKMPTMTVQKVGYGLGKRETGRLNALRVLQGTLDQESNYPVEEIEEIVALETNIDDMSPEVSGYLLERLLEGGALDVYYTPIYMKKNRPAVMITTLSHQKDEQKLVEIIFRESSTLGIRRRTLTRYCLVRDRVEIATEFGPVHVKVATLGNSKKVAPEYEDCREIAKRSGLPLQEIYHRVLNIYNNLDML